MYYGRKCIESVAFVVVFSLVCSVAADACDKSKQKPAQKPECKSKSPAKPSHRASVVKPKRAPQPKVVARPKPVVRPRPAAPARPPVVRPPARPVPQPGCPPVPCCCQDAKVCIAVQTGPVCYTASGVTAFTALFRDAAAQGVENATIRAFNATKVVPACVDGKTPKK